jgi:hypothetical protein
MGGDLDCDGRNPPCQTPRLVFELGTWSPIPSPGSYDRFLADERGFVFARSGSGFRMPPNGIAGCTSLPSDPDKPFVARFDLDGKCGFVTLMPDLFRFVEDVQIAANKHVIAVAPQMKEGIAEPRSSAAPARPASSWASTAGEVRRPPKQLPQGPERVT